ncbi:MAG: phosphoribosylaminoimidazolesuccinocarboxamide synthase [bacterium]|nr:phosphoribosylaminoimidazolesuccinocarboxamide synthase [bacterium]
MPPLFESSLPHLKLLFRGKVRDIYDCGDELLLVATDRLSAFDVVFPNPIPGKGEILTQMSLFWFDRMKNLIPNHLSKKPVRSVLKTAEEIQMYEKRSMLVTKTKPLTIEAVVRGYLAGSGWKDYKKTGAVCGIKLPSGMQEAQKLPEPIFTPATKAPQGSHDENISFEAACESVGKEIAEKVKQISLKIYSEGTAYAETRGLILADTKFEFGLKDGQLILIDEVLTADSSRFWPKSQYKVGISPPSFDKQFVRDYLESIHWNKKPPAPELPQEIVQKTTEKYQEALKRLTQ